MKWKKYLSALLTVVVVIAMTGTCMLPGGADAVQAAAKEPIDTRTAEGSPERKTNEEAYAMTVDSNEMSGWPTGPQTYGEAGIVMDVDSGAVLYAKNIDGAAYPASITKVLTVLIALENAKLTDTVTVTQESVDCVQYGYAHIALLPGEEITLKDALYAVLLASANEAAYAVGESVGEGYDWFIKEMNERTKELGGMHSNFVNTNGMDDENHYTCARDMALITRELMRKHPEFEEICQTLQYTIPATNKTSETRTFQQRHEMLYQKSQYYNEYAVAGKTGFTDTALNTLISAADNGKNRLVCVVLKTHGQNVYKDSLALLDYGFSNFKNVSIAENETSEDIESVEDGAYVVLPDGVKFSDLKMEIVPSKEDGKSARIVYTYEDNPVGEADAVLSKSYWKKNGQPEITEKTQAEKKRDRKNAVPLWVRWTLMILAGLILCLSVWLAVAVHIRKKRIEERRRRRAQQRRRQRARYEQYEQRERAQMYYRERERKRQMPDRARSSREHRR